ncbi:NPL4-like protein [Platanthera guangdongensis]|uniref:NPL4-like protein n=1 Tax=Platanthera guangdongensis TaxID=2320717 RepID=A0ABR2MFR8_9ASPA
MSIREMIQVAEVLQVEGLIQEWMTVMMKLDVNKDGAANVHFQAFKMSYICIKLVKEGVA